MSLGKRLLESPLVLALVRTAFPVYRTAYAASALLRYDRRLKALLRSREPAIFAVWHQDFLHTVGWLSRFNVRRPTFVLASASRDGGLAAAAAEGVGFRRVVRGSSARGGGRALLAMHRLLAGRGASAVVVCDGPRPPAREMKPGIVHLARESGLPIWLLRTSYHPVRVLEGTWARFHWPPFGARVAFVADGPIRVPAEADRDEVERRRAELGRRLDALADRADAVVADRQAWKRL